MIPRVFGIDYRFLACGPVFTHGLEHAAESLGVPYAHADWSASNLPTLVDRFTPDLIFVVHGRKFAQRWRATFAGKYQTAIWLLDEPYEVDDTARFSPLFANVFLNDPATLHRHPRTTYLPVCYDPQTHHPGTDPRPHQVGFIGGGNQNRDRHLAALAKAGVLSYVIGGTWSDPGVNKLCRARNVEPLITATWYRTTRIVINVFREQHHYNAQKIQATAMNPRIYEATACGALVVSEWRPEIAAVVPDLPTFRSIPECVDLIQALLADPARAESIRAKVASALASHTYADRLATVLKVTCGYQAEAA